MSEFTTANLNDMTLSYLHLYFCQINFYSQMILQTDIKIVSLREGCLQLLQLIIGEPSRGTLSENSPALSLPSAIRLSEARI